MEKSTVSLPLEEGLALSVTTYRPETTGTPPYDLVLLHGWPNAGRVWRALADALLTHSPYRLIAPTFRGYGDSARVSDGYTCARFAEDILATISSLGLTHFTLIGHSMGGKVAQLVAARQPAGLERLVLVCPVPLTGSPVSEERKSDQRAIYGDPDRTRAFLTSMSANGIADQLMDPLLEEALRCSPAAFNGWIDLMREEDYSGELARIAAPTMVFHGEKDPLRSEEQLGSEVVDRIGGARLEVLPGVGHLPHLENPRLLADRLHAFLQAEPTGEAI